MVQGLRPIERSQLLHNPGGARLSEWREFGAEMRPGDHSDGAGVSRAPVGDREPGADSLALTRCHNWP